MSSHESNARRYAYRARLVVDIYFRTAVPDDPPVTGAVDRFVGEINNVLAGDPQVDGASVIDRRLFAERGEAE